MSDEIVIDGERYVSSKRAAEMGKYTQDYVGQLSRLGHVQARRVGGLWYVSVDSLEKYKKKAEEYKPIPPVNNNRNDQEAFLSFDGKAYLSASRAAELTGYSADYVGQLARSGNVPSRLVGNRWFIERQALVAHKEEKDSLLAAVQTESVGIKRPESIGAILEDRYSALEKGAPIKYTKDEGDLLPVIEIKTPGLEVNKELHSIPIHVRHVEIERKPIMHKAIQVKMPEIKRMPAKIAVYSGSMPLAVLTIIIVLSLGFVTLKKSSIYTQGNGTEEKSQLASVSSSAITQIKGSITRLGDILEPYLSQELIFQRQQQ